MKNLTKLFALIALITANASNVCAQIADTTIIKPFIEGSMIDTVIYNCDSVTIEIDQNTEELIAGNIKYKNTTVNFNLFEKSLIFGIKFPKMGEVYKINITSGQNISYTIKIKYHTTYATGLNDNLLANDVNLFCYNNTIVLENKVAPKKLSVNIYNLTGQLVLTESTEGLNTHNEFNTNLPNGIYVVHVSDGVNTMVKKLLIGKHKN